MAIATLKNFLRYPHGRSESIEGINYEVVQFVICPKCWVMYIYIYLISTIALIASCVVIITLNIGASVAIVIFGFALLTITEIFFTHFLPGTKTCQDLPFPPQSGEFIKLLPFIRMAFKNTSEESKTRFLRLYSQVELNEMVPEDSTLYQKLSVFEQESEVRLLHQKGSKNNMLLLGESEEDQCRVHDSEVENESNAALFRPSVSEKSYESEMPHRSFLKGDLLHRPISCGECEAGLIRRPLLEKASKIALLPTEEYKASTFQRQSKAVPLSEKESKASQFRSPLIEGEQKAVQYIGPLSKRESKTMFRRPLSERESNMLQSFIPLLKGEPKVVPSRIPLSERELNVVPSRIPLSEGESKVVPSRIPLSEGDPKVVTSHIPLSERESNVVPSRIPWSEREPKMIPSCIPLSEGQPKVVPYRVPLSEGEPKVVTSRIPSPKGKSKSPLLFEKRNQNYPISSTIARRKIQISAIV